MYVTFKNNSTSNKVTVTAENRSFTVNPESSAEMFFANGKIEFSVKLSPLEVLTEAIEEMDAEVKDYSFKDKIIAKLTKKFANKLTDMVLNIELKYQVDLSNSDNTVVNLYDGVYSVCDGKFAEFFDMMPVMYSFCRAESDLGIIKITDITLTNRKKYLKLFRNCLLFVNSGLFIVDWFFFIPSYMIIKFLSSMFFIKKLMAWLYGKSRDERTKILDEKEQMYEKEDKRGGCLSTILKLVIFLLILVGLIIWANNDEPEVILSEDFSLIFCFEETYVRIDGELPQNAEKSFLESYFAFYPLEDGGYESDRYYCNVYETPDGTRYILLIDNGENDEDIVKDYDETENTMVYILNETKGE